MRDAELPTDSGLLESGWLGAIEACDEKECWQYSIAFFRAADAALEHGQVGEYHALRLLGNATSMVLRLDDRSAPLVPMVRLATGRSAALEDFGDPELAPLRGFIPTVTDPELKARLCDILWIQKRDHAAAADAVASYLASATALEHPEHWPACTIRFERAAQLAAALRRRDLLETAIGAISETLARHGGRDPLYLSARLMELLLKHKQGDPVACAAIAETAASAAIASGNFEKATTYLEFKARWHARAGQSEAAVGTLTRIGNLWFAAAEGAATASDPSFTHAVLHAQRALKALEKVPGTRKRRREIHAALLRYQSESVKELKRFEVTRDITHLVKQAEAMVSCKTPCDALVALALAYRPIDPVNLRERVKEQAREHPISYLFSSAVLTNQGRVAGQRGSLLAGVAEETEPAVEAEMFRHLTIHQTLLGQALIEPARRRIVFEHEIREMDLRALLARSPFVPADREALYAKGLAAGLQGDFTAATHLLIPQLEHAVRVLLSRSSAALTSVLKPDGTQDELDLNTTLRMPELGAVLGANIVFDLRGLLIERFGSNLRNRFAHGLMHSQEFQSYDGVYLWWVMLFLSVAPVFSETPPDDGGEVTTQDADADCGSPAG